MINIEVDDCEALLLVQTYICDIRKECSTFNLCYIDLKFFY